MEKVQVDESSACITHCGSIMSPMYKGGEIYLGCIECDSSWPLKELQFQFGFFTREEPKE